MVGIVSKSVETFLKVEILSGTFGGTFEQRSHTKGPSIHKNNKITLSLNLPASYLES